ncbi:MAG: hypothetical protein WAW06_11755 [bacterium]
MSVVNVLAVAWPFLPLVGLAVLAVLLRKSAASRGSSFFLTVAAVAVVYLVLGVVFGNLSDIGFNGRML